MTQLVSKFERINGILVLSLMGRNLSGADVITVLKTTHNFRIGGSAEQMLLSKNSDGFDANHRVPVGAYRVALLPTKLIDDASLRTSKNLKKLAKELLGCSDDPPRAGITAEIPEVFSDELMQKENLEYIAAVHTPIVAFGEPRILAIRLYEKTPKWFGSFRHKDGDMTWNEKGAHAVLLP